ncbi:MAG TPA: amidohydrolase family protein [Vicinamibacterales bacterium]|nr:amidohydrolase family protein [Vicinamibacterales bacterium]
MNMLHKPAVRSAVVHAGVLGAVLLALVLLRPTGAQGQGAADEFYDSHFHLTNYIQQGIDVRQYMQIMGARVRRSTLFGIPLQQQWSYANSGNFAPTYYLHSDAPLYYYSFTDAFIAMAYRSLSKDEQARFDPMITGFNPADMYGVDHIRRVLTTFPGVFTGIGEFSIHKEFVSAKIPGETASLTNPALDRILDFAAESGLVVIIHNDIDMPFAKTDAQPVYLEQMQALLKRHQNASIIWAHVGLGRIVHPVQVSGSVQAAERNPTHLELIEAMLMDPGFNHVNFDISWDEVAKYAVASPEVIARVSAILNRHPDRFLFGTDTVAPQSPAAYYAVFDMWKPVWSRLTADASQKIRIGNYERIFNQGRQRVRAWEKANTK